MIEGNVAVITGAGSGLGRALAVNLGYRGARVFATDIDAEGAALTAQMVKEAGGEAMSERVDTTDPAAVERMAEATFDTWGRCDLLVNNAGVGAAGLIGEAPLDDWRWVMDVNLYGVLYGCRSFAPRMRSCQTGTIVNIASIAAFARTPMMGAYNVSKTAVVALSETLRAECMNDGVGVTVVCPAFFRTNIGRNSRASASAGGIDITKLVDRSKVSADDIARAIIEAVAKGDPYVVPTLDAKVMWYLRRLAPARAGAILAQATKLLPLLMARGGKGKRRGSRKAGAEAQQ